jgi:hypothetical protein
VADTRAPDTGREYPTGALPRSSPDALLAARGLDWKAVPPTDHDTADTELLEVVTLRQRRLGAWWLLIAAAVLGLAVLVGIAVSVLTVSDDSTQQPFAPLTPISVPAQAPALTPSQAAPAPAFDQPVAPVPPLAPVTATAETVAPYPREPHERSKSPTMRERLHEMFPQLFPDDPQQQRPSQH